jgi:hypothetical protein
MQRTSFAKIVLAAAIPVALLTGCATQEDLDALRGEIQQVSAQAGGAEQTAQTALEAARSAVTTARAADAKAEAASLAARQAAQEAALAREEAQAASEKADRIFRESLRKN